MTPGDAAGADSPTVEAIPHLCGCAGKTPLDGVVYPARRRIRERLRGTSVRLAGAMDAALLPRRTRLGRRVRQEPLGDGLESVAEDVGPVAEDVGVGDTPPASWFLGATFAADGLADAERFAADVGDAYARLGTRSTDANGDRSGRGTTIVGKGHSVQVPAATTSQQWFERLAPRGARRVGYWAANVDVVHAFPGLRPTQQAAVAVVHALNDCYALGGVDDRRVRPLVAVPRETNVTTETVARWYDDGVPPGVTLAPPSVVDHDGSGWLFGASVVAAVTTRPPVRVGAVEPGDAVLLHRPLGALATYSLSVESPSDAGVRQRAVAALTADHRDAARVLTSFCPDPGEAFDPARHVKVVTDVSGPGVEALARLVAPLRLHLTSLPLVDADAVTRARDRWLTPDVTVETNGPLAVVARPAVVDAVFEALSSAPGHSPAHLGEVRRPADGASGLTASDDVALGRYVERYVREGR